MLKIAHRGASGYELENTEKAFRKALRLNTELIELDVRQTKDKKLVVHHDDRLTRTTGNGSKIKDLSLKALKKLRQKNGDKILTLSEALKLLKNKCACKIDVKEKGMEEKIGKVVKRFGMEKQVIITTDYFSVAHKIKRKYPELKVALGGIKGKKSAEEIIQKAKRARVDIISVHYSTVNKKLIKEAHKNGLLVDVWTVNDEDKIKKLKEWGVDAITTDYPDKL